MSWRRPHAPHAPAPFAPPAVDPARTRTPRCRHCDADVVFVEMDATGKLMPCDPEMLNGDGRRSLVVRWPKGRRLVGRVIAKAPEDVVGLEPHWGTCANRPGAAAPETASATAAHLRLVEVPR